MRKNSLVFLLAALFSAVNVAAAPFVYDAAWAERVSAAVAQAKAKLPMKSAQGSMLITQLDHADRVLKVTSTQLTKDEVSYELEQQFEREMKYMYCVGSMNELFKNRIRLEWQVTWTRTKQGRGAKPWTAEIVPASCP